MDDNNPIFGEDGVVPSDRSAGNNSLFIGGGEIARLMRAIDWSKTALGPVEGWSQALKSAISIMLPSKAQICLFWGPAFTILYNDAYSQIMGEKHPHVLATPGWVAWQEIWDDTLAPLLNQVVQTGESFWAQQYPFFLQRYGFLEETYFDISYDPIRDETGAVGGIFCIVSDQSRRVISERRLGILRLLAAQTSSYKTISAACIAAVEVLTGAMRDVPFALLYLVEDGTPQLVAKSGVSVEEGGALLMPLLGQVLTDGAASLIDDLERYFEVAPAGVWEGDPPRRAAVLPIRSPSGAETVGVLVCGVSPRLAYDEEYSGFLALVVRHIAASIANAQAHEYERHRAEALAEMDHAKNEFFANVSHEFRTPLTLMLNPLQDLIQSGTLDMDQEETLDLAHRNGLRLLKLVNTLLDFSQTQAERAGASFSPTDLAQFTADLASSFRSLSEQAGLKYVIDCPPLPEPIYIDREMWEKIVLNLLSNAFKFTFTGEIRVSVRLAGEFAVMQVQDTGVGIAADELPRIFERFHRVRESRSRTHEGTGIGLALVQELVRLHNGTVDAESTPDVGTTFTVTIPRGSAHLPPDRVRPAQDAPPTVSRTRLNSLYTAEATRWLPSPASSDVVLAQTGPHLLIVDDNADMRDYLRRVLETSFRVSVVNDGIAALEFVAREMPDMVIADVMMPRLDGFGLIERLRADTRTQALPIMLLTAREGTQSRVEGLRYGADDYLIKPFSVGELRARVESTLNLARLRARLLDQEQETRRQVERILESITDAFYALDFGWRITYANQSMARDIGMTVADLIGRNLWEVFPLSVGSPAWQALHRVMEEREPLTFESVNYRGNNWLEVSAHPTDGGISVYYRDISARVRAERRVRHLQEVTAALTGANTLDQIADIIIERALSAIETDRGTMGLVSEDGQTIDMLRQTELAHLNKSWMRVPLRAGSGILSDVILTGEPILFSEQQEYVDAYPHLAQNIRDEFDVHSVIGLPLRTREQVIGAMVLVFSHARRLALEEKTFLMTLADYCAQALERAQLFDAERRARQQNQRLAERLARLQSLIIALSGVTTLQHIFDIVLNQAVPALGAHAGLIMLLSEDRQYVEVVADTGYPSEVVEAWRRFPTNLKSTMVMMAIERRDLLLVHTPDELEALIKRPRAESVHTAWATLPLIIDGEAIGGLGFSYLEPQAFDAADQQLMRTLAEQCSQAIYRIRLMEEQRIARQRAEQAATRIARLQLITSELAQSISPDEAADAVLHQGLEAVGAVAGAVTLLSDDGKVLNILQAQGYSPEIMALWRFVPLDSTIAPLAFAVRRNEAIWLRTPEERRALIGDLPPDRYSPDHHAWASIPLIVNGRCIGALGLSFREPQAFDADQRAFALALADQCAQALERTRLQQVATEAAAYEERQRLARDLHDSVSQVLYSATNTAEAIPRLLERNPARAREELEQLIILNRAAMAEMRALLLELRPESIVRTPLKQLLEQLTRAIQGRKQIQIDFTFDADPELRLPPNAHVAFYRIAQEAVNNLVKHSGANYMEIRFEETPRYFQMHINDDGQGFDIKRTSMGMGTATMRERALEIGGELHLRSAPNEGTRVALEWAKR